MKTPAAAETPTNCMQIVYPQDYLIGPLSKCLSKNVFYPLIWKRSDSGPIR